MMNTLNAQEIAAALAGLQTWQMQAASIRRQYVFKDFPTAIQFVQQVAEAAEKAWHHPDIDIRWNKVTLVLTTHDAGGLTHKDFALAAVFDSLASGLLPPEAAAV